MKLTYLFWAAALSLAASSLAASPDKGLVCHVGNTTGPSGEVYLDDPDCVPGEDNGYFCPDAGKIDLIVVGNVSAHLDNDSHSWDGISDYGPFDVGASGDGTEDGDGNGVDDGCEIPDVCPCWDVSELQAVTADNFYPFFGVACNSQDYPIAVLLSGGDIVEPFGFYAVSNPLLDEYFCEVFVYPEIDVQTDVEPAEADVCIAQLAQRCANIGHLVVPE